MLEVCGLTKRYGNSVVVDRVSFTIRPGEILGYLGPNGAGKSTTIKMLIGLIEPGAGQILFHGRPVRANLKDFQHRIGYVPEEPNLYPHLSGREYLQLAGRLRGIRAARRSSLASMNCSACSDFGTTVIRRSLRTPKACARRSCFPPRCSTIPNC